MGAMQTAILAGRQKRRQPRRTTVFRLIAQPIENITILSGLLMARSLLTLGRQVHRKRPARVERHVRSRSKRVLPGCAAEARPARSIASDQQFLGTGRQQRVGRLNQCAGPGAGASGAAAGLRHRRTGNVIQRQQLRSDGPLERLERFSCGLRTTRSDQSRGRKIRRHASGQCEIRDREIERRQINRQDLGRLHAHN